MKLYRVETLGKFDQMWNPVQGGQGCKMWAEGFAAGMLSFSPCPSLRVCVSEDGMDGPWGVVQEYQGNGKMRVK